MRQQRHSFATTAIPPPPPGYQASYQTLTVFHPGDTVSRMKHHHPLYHPGTVYTTSPQYTTPGDKFLNSKILPPGGQYTLVYTVRRETVV